MERIVIALPSDEQYVCGLTVTAASLAMYASREVVLAFHILDGGIRDDTFAAFEAKVRPFHSHCEFYRHRVDEAAFKDFPAWSGNRMTYARLLIPQFLPEEEFCIYSDSDFLWLTDIAELWQLRKREVIFQSARETYDRTLDREETWFREHNLPFDRNRYICAGLSFYNLRLMREEKSVQKISDFITQHPDIRMADQTAINALLRDRLTVLDSRWQRLTISREDGERVLGKALHYAGEIPWKRGLWTQMLTDTILLWHRYNGKIHRRSTWWSLRQSFSCREILERRALWYVMRLPFLRGPFALLLSRLNRGHYLPEMVLWTHAITEEVL